MWLLLNTSQSNVWRLLFSKYILFSKVSVGKKAAENSENLFPSKCRVSRDGRLSNTEGCRCEIWLLSSTGEKVTSAHGMLRDLFGIYHCSSRTNVSIMSVHWTKTHPVVTTGYFADIVFTRHHSPWKVDEFNFDKWLLSRYSHIRFFSPPNNDGSSCVSWLLLRYR